jgi:hypothetical protein
VDLLDTVINAAIVAIVGGIVAWAGRSRFDSIDARFESVDTRFDAIDARFTLGHHAGRPGRRRPAAGRERLRAAVHRDGQLGGRYSPRTNCFPVTRLSR